MSGVGERVERRRAWAREYLRTHPDYAERARERARAAQAAKRAADPGYQHRARFYAELVELQGGEVCAICGAEPPSGKRLQVDHDHTTGEVRGLLCARCNRMLGQAGDTEDLLLKAIEYLRGPYTGREYADYTAVKVRIRYTRRDVR